MLLPSNDKETIPHLYPSPWKCISRGLDPLSQFIHFIEENGENIQTLEDAWIGDAYLIIGFLTHIVTRTQNAFIASIASSHEAHISWNFNFSKPFTDREANDLF